MTEKLIINVNRIGYSTSQIRRTLTVGQLISLLDEFDEDMEIYLGSDKQHDGSWYTYGGITESDFGYLEEDEEEE